MDTFAVDITFADGQTESYKDVGLSNGGVMIFDEVELGAWTWLPPQEIKRVVKRKRPA
jgi:hypothetical protein